jgi:hypothetical protein
MGSQTFASVPALYVGGSKRGSKRFATTVGKAIGSQLDLELRDLRAERGPRERRVDGDDVTARSVADRLEEIAARAVDLRERDERATEIVSASLAKSERLEIVVALLRVFWSERAVMLRVDVTRSVDVAARGCRAGREDAG